jgi:glutathione S-transferase
MTQLEIVGRSSSHFTRTARFFAFELAVPHTFRPVFDLTTLDAGAYAENPALKVPSLITAEGPLFGTENVCRELVRRAAPGPRVILRGDVADRLVANAEELTFQAMLTEVNMILAKIAGGDRPLPAKLGKSLENTLDWLDAHVDRALALLPADRRFSFLEVTLFCLVTHLPFRDVIDVRRYARLAAHCERFAEREGARQTPYRFDAP